MPALHFKSESEWLKLIIFISLSLVFYYSSVYLHIGSSNTAPIIWGIIPTVITLLLYKNNQIHFFIPDRNSFYNSLFAIFCVFANFIVITLIAIAFGYSFQVNSSLSELSASGNIMLNMGLNSLAEEMFFRGIIFLSLITLYKESTAVIVTSLIFSLGHITNPNISWLAVTNVFIAGVLFSSIAITAKSLIPSIIFHITWNLVECFGIGSPVSGLDFSKASFGYLTRTDTSYVGDFFIGGNFGVEESILTTCLLLLNIVLFKNFVNKFNSISVIANKELLVNKFFYSNFLFRKKYNV